MGCRVVALKEIVRIYRDRDRDRDRDRGRGSEPPQATKSMRTYLPAGTLPSTPLT